MVSKQISNPLQAWTSGASWGTPSIDNEMSQEVVHLLNGTGLSLYTGDIVCLDVTGTQAVLSTVANDPTVFGVVGGAEIGGSYPSTATPASLSTTQGGYFPPELEANVTAAMGFTNGSGTVTYAGAVATDLGSQLIPAFSATNNATPLVYTITAVNVGVGYTVTPVFNGTTGSFSTLKQMAPSNIGPGWGPASAYPIGVQVPVIKSGYGRVNINAVAAIVAKDLVVVSNGTVIGTRVAAGAQALTNIGAFIAVALEAYAARDVTLTNAGILGHDTIRALISKF